MGGMKSCGVRRGAFGTWCACATVLLLTACGGGSGPTPGDGGADSSLGSDSAIGDSGMDSATVCTSDVQCDDGLFCNGEEHCLPADALADAEGCAPSGADACLAGQTCDEAGAVCQTMCDISGDADGDGHDSIDCGGDDCDDADALNYPGNVELCDADRHDEDCDPTTLGTDGDTDGDGHLRIECCNPQADGTDLCGDDCDDDQMDIHPGALEVCDGDVDNDCNGLADALDGVCVPCDAGYRGFDGSCENIDECVESPPCGSASGTGCIDTPGNYICTCPSGYTAPAIGGTCVDDDECLAGSPCGTAAGTTCTNTPGSYTCSCASGYDSPTPGAPCTDVDECATGTPCGSASGTTCLNSIGGYGCICPPGYTFDGTTCVDDDECATGTPCGGVAGGSCGNTPGSYVCTCPSGYDAPASGGSCGDINECVTLAPCGTVVGTSCVNAPGSYSCMCPSGYTFDGTTCADVNECAAGAPCGTGATCGNTIGSYACGCPPGYTAPATGGTCVDEDECAASAPCGALPGMTCTNQPGTYSCACPSGYRAPTTGGSCLNIDECTESPPCGRVLAVDGCTDTPGTYQCRCNAGYFAPANGGTCELTNADLSNLVPSPVGSGLVSGSIASPDIGFITTVRDYTLELPAATTSFTLAATVDDPAGATITIGVNDPMPTTVLPSGTPSAPISMNGWSQVVVTVVVTTEHGETSTYTVTASREVTYVKASESLLSDSFGGTMAFSADGMTMAVGVTGSVSTLDSVLIYHRTGAVWVEEGIVTASIPDLWDSFSTALSLSSDGSTLAVGASQEQSCANGIDGNQLDNNCQSAGAVYVFERSGTMWSQQHYIKASHSDANDQFGAAVVLSGDGSTLVVGAPGEESSALGVGADELNNTTFGYGAAYVFVRSGGTWVQQEYIKASNAGQDEFGRAVSLSNDGSTLAVGATLEDSAATGVGGDESDNSAGSSGAVYVFVRSSGTWSQQAYVKASNTDAQDTFGGSVSLSGDGSTLAVGAQFEKSNATGVNGIETDNSIFGAGAVYVYVRSGLSWSQQAYIKSSNNDNGGGSIPGDSFYRGVLSSDGTTLLVGAPREDSHASGLNGIQSSNVSNSSGAAYLFTRVGPAWTQRAYINAPNADPNDRFGSSVGISTDGNLFAIGAIFEASSVLGINADDTLNDAPGSGAVYIY